MNELRLKSPPLKLDGEDYRGLRLKVLGRDGWRCQFCSSRANLQVHHQVSRSQQGDDEESNLITLCASCHDQVHKQP